MGSMTGNKRGPKETGRGSRIYLDKRLYAIVQTLKEFPELQTEVESLLFRRSKEISEKGLTEIK